MHEEIAFASDTTQVLGRLTPLDIPVSGFRLHPIVAAVDHRLTSVHRITRSRASSRSPSTRCSIRARTLAADDPRRSFHINVPTFVVDDG